MRSFIVIS